MAGDGVGSPVELLGAAGKIAIPRNVHRAEPSLVRVALCVQMAPTTTLPKLIDSGVYPRA